MPFPAQARRRFVYKPGLRPAEGRPDHSCSAPFGPARNCLLQVIS